MVALGAGFILFRRFQDVQVQFPMQRGEGGFYAIEPGCVVEPEQAIDLFAGAPAHRRRRGSWS